MVVPPELETGGPRASGRRYDERGARQGVKRSEPERSPPPLARIEAHAVRQLRRRPSDSQSINAGFTPHQFTSDEEVLAAAAGPNPEITIVETDEVYRCSVVASGVRIAQRKR
jgi:hypothetical protein